MSAGYPDTNAHVLHCPTRWGDVDENGHINNARLVSYIQEGIHDLFNHHAKAARESLFPAGFLIARHEIDYLEQLHHRPEPLEVRLTVERLGRSSAHVRVDVCRDPHIYMTARTVVVARDRASGRSRRLTHAERRFLSAYLPTADQVAADSLDTAPQAAGIVPQRSQSQLDVRELETTAVGATGDSAERPRCSMLAGPHGEREVEHGQQRSWARDRDYRRIGGHTPSSWGRSLPTAPSARADRPLSPSTPHP
ncbi:MULTISPECIES: acyl-CoA thioesterase [Kitasatospora]|uniref:Thioesterase n=1 Tax=Kitasatospora cystarginea TaxID=58350 RepID=A0ABP5RMU1_9ACTN